MKLSDAKIRSLKANGKRFKLSDGGGLQLLVHTNGSKYWQFKYRFGEKERSLSIGVYPQVSLAEAREKRGEAELLLRQNLDPSSQKRQEKLVAVYRDRNTFFAVAEEWWKKNIPRWTPRHADRTWARLVNHVFPHLKGRAIAEIKPLEVLAVIEKIEAKKATETSRIVLRICSSVFRFAIITGRLEHNPAINLSDALMPHRVVHFPSLPQEKIGKFLRDLDQLNTTEQNRLAVKLLLHTAVRTGELRFSKWKHIELGENLWRIPAEYTKTKTEHTVPLSKQCLEILSELKAITGGGEWLFPNQQGYRHPVMSENTINALINRMGYKGEVVGHGFRSMFSTILNENGFNRDAIERQLAHQERNRVRAAYNRAEYFTERQEMMQWWSDFLTV